MSIYYPNCVSPGFFAEDLEAPPPFEETAFWTLFIHSLKTFIYSLKDSITKLKILTLLLLFKRIVENIIELQMSFLLIYCVPIIHTIPTLLTVIS